ncbi:MAG TPA: hypothetical protein VNT32_12995 [Thermoleophilaceae bacterium]|nr:hypothetical protein [Thermoleophilaceae bacterium]
MTGAARRRGRIGTTLRRALAASLTVAAAAAAIAIVDRSFDETEARVIATSLGFAVFSSMGAAGMALRPRSRAGLRALGTVTAALSAGTFAALLWAVWGDADAEVPARVFGCAAVASIAASHAALVAGARRADDSRLVSFLVVTSIGLGIVDAVAAAAPISGATGDVDEGLAQAMAVVLVAFLLTTALPPILRRGGPAAAATPRTPAEVLAARVVEAADRIDALCADPGDRRVEIRRECNRLRAAARGMPAH